jgi:hypothetical protein
LTNTRRESRVKKLEDSRVHEEKELKELRSKQLENENSKKRKRIGKFLKDLEQHQDTRLKEHPVQMTEIKKLLHTKILPEINEEKE